MLLLLAAGVIFVGWLAFSFFKEITELLTWVFFALFASFALEPAVDWLAKHGWRRGLATGLIMFGLAAASILMVALMIPMIVKQVQQLIHDAPEILNSIDTFSQRWFNVEVSPEKLQEQLQTASTDIGRFATDIAGNVFGIASSLIGGIFKLLTIGLFTFYLTADGPRFRRTICSTLPPKYQERVIWTWELSIEKTGAYLYSRLLLALVSGVATFIVLVTLGVPFALPLALWMGLVSQFIPTIGTYIAMALPLLIAVVHQPIDALVLLIFFTLYQQLENYVLSPRITASTMALHPAIAFGCAVAGAGIAGVIGAFLALPLAAIVQAIISSAVERHDVMDTDLTRVGGYHDGEEAEAVPIPGSD